MHLRVVSRVIGITLVVFSVCLLIPLIPSVYFNDGSHWVFIRSGFVTIILGLVLFLIGSRADRIGVKEATAIVAIAWLIVPVMGALPYIMSDHFTNTTDALFESISGLTTTGSTILTKIEQLPKGILFWRSMTHWLGGMGILFLVLVILPTLGVGGMNLYEMEGAASTEEKIAPQMRVAAELLWIVYLVLTVLLALFLYLGDMSIFDSVTHAMATISTGGFSTHSESISYFDSTYLQSVFIAFMFLSGISFALHYSVIKHRSLRRIFTDEVKFYIAVLIIASTIVVIDLNMHNRYSLTEAIRYGVFQVVSINTTTGFTNADFSYWPPLSQFCLLVLMFIGACPGSTTGAIKNFRVIVLFKAIVGEMKRIVHPHAVVTVRVNKQTLTEDVIRKILVFIGLYFFVFLIASILLIFSGIDIVSTISAVTTTLGGVGPGLGIDGPMEGFHLLTSFDKWVLMGCMLLGRLEFFVLIVLFMPSLWQQR